MDQYIELIAYYLSDWKYTAIYNTRYSVVLAALAFLAGGMFISLLKRSSIKGLSQRVAEQNETIEQVKTKQEELLNKQKEDEEQKLVLQKKTDQLKTDVQKNEQLLNKSLDEKKIAANEFTAALNEKTQYSEQLKAELKEQKDKVSEYVVSQAKLVEVEKEVNETANKLDLSTQQLQQLETELNDKVKQIEELESVKQPFESEGMQQQLTKLESEIKVLQKKNKEAESKAAIAEDLENTIEQQNQQIAKFNNKLKLLLPQQSSALIDIPEVVIDEEENEGIVKKVISLFKSMNSQVDDDDNQKTVAPTSLASSTSEYTEDVWQQHQTIIKQLSEQLIIKQAEGLKPEAAKPEVLKTKALKPEVKVEEDKPEHTPKVNHEETDNPSTIEEDESIIVENTNDLAESLEYVQGKLKSLFNKIKS